MWGVFLCSECFPPVICSPHPKSQITNPPLPAASINLRPSQGPAAPAFHQDRGAGSGLVNDGNTCFINALLQGLAHCPPLVQRFINDPAAWLSPEDPTTQAVRQLLADVRRGSTHDGPLHIEEQIQPLRRLAGTGPGEQGDVHELYTKLVESTCMPRDLRVL